MAAPKTQAAAGKPWRPLTVETDEKLEELLAQPGIKVVDLYGWAGPCEAVFGTFADLFFGVNDEKALQFLMVSAESCKLLEQAPEQYRTCCPMFLIFQDGWVKDDIRQPNPVAVRKAVRRLLEPPPPIEAIEPPKANPYAAAIAKRQEAEAEARAKADAERPAPPPGSYQAQLAAMFAPDGGVAYKYRPEEWTREFEVPPLEVP